ncbi:MAG TPA: SCO family protein [Tepidisphaeraceae bacterium]
MPCSAGASDDKNPANVFDGVGIDQKLDSQLPLEAVFRDETGGMVKLGDYFGRKPVVLALVYYKCPMLCTMVLNDLVRTMRSMKMAAGTDYDVVAVSFDPQEGPDLSARKKTEYVKWYGRPGGDIGWHFLTGSETSIKSLTDAVGFHYKWDNKSKQFVHASGISVITPQGKISQYFYGIQYEPKALTAALERAAGEKIGAVVPHTVAYCFQYDPVTGKYGLIVVRAVKVGGVLAMLGLGAFIYFSARRERTSGSDEISDEPKGAAKA